MSAPELPVDDLSPYVCELDEASKKVAQKELQEDPKNTMGAIDTLRKWIDEQKHVKFTKDTKILLAYLRYAKFSQLKARQTIENHLNYKTENPTWFDGLDPFNPNVERLVRDGFVLPLPGYDENGYKRILYRGARYDPAVFKNKKHELVNAFYTIFFHIVMFERTQVNGIVYLSDMSGLTMAHQTFWGIDDMRKMMKFWQNTVPARFKGFYNYNIGPIFEAMMSMFMPFLSKKMKDRFHMCGSNMEVIYKKFPMEILPVEYLPDDYKGPNAGTLDSLADDMLKSMRSAESVRFLSLISHPNWKIDKSAKDDVPSASFRKLNVD